MKPTTARTRSARPPATTPAGPVAAALLSAVIPAAAGVVFLASQARAP